MPTIIAFVSDLFFLSRIENAAERLELDLEIIESTSDIPQVTPDTDPDLPGEALSGLDGALIRRISETHPGLMIFDISLGALPWKRWIALLKTSAATRRIPILAFGSHMDVETMTAAKNAGADLVIARSRFTSELLNLIQSNIHAPDLEAIAAACRGPLSDLAIEGIQLFNQGEYFESHEVLENAWNADESAAKELYRAILQVAVAYLQIERRNYRGAVKMFLRVRQWIDTLPEVCRGVDVADLRANAMAVEAALLEVGEEGIAGMDTGAFKPVHIYT